MAITGHDHPGRILLDGLDDRSHLAAAARCVRRHLPTDVSDGQVRELTLEALRTLLDGGLIEVGDAAARFVGWGLDPLGALARIAATWQGSDRDLGPGDVCWLVNTDAGDELGEAIWQQDIRPLRDVGGGLT